MNDLSKIKHVVVLMLENRSFDNVFGFLRPAGDGFDGLAGAACPGNNGIPPWQTEPGSDCSTMPDPDPGESFDDITGQLYGTDVVNGVPPMSGFVDNYEKHHGTANAIMHCFTPNDLPVLSQLANSFAISDRWFASAPCQTWPNRFFAHAGTANGYENNTLDGFPFPMQTIFNELQGVVPWKIYFHDFPQAALLSRLWPYFANFRPFDRFIQDAAAGQLPAYAFIEPMYYPGTELPNDMHPPHNVQLGEALVARVYNAVRSSPNWTSTLLIVVFDEHGGCFDHVAPPAATPPEPARPKQNFAFDRYGVRVPAVLISPYTAAGTVLRPAGNTPFDHTSIISTVRNCFGIAGPLTARDAAAPDLSGALNTDFDLHRGPAEVTAPTPWVSDAVLQAARGREVNSMQDLLALAAKNLAPLSSGRSVAQHLQDLLKATNASATGATIPSALKPTAGAAGDEARSIMQRILARFAQAGTNANPNAIANTIYRGH
ncbi:alkaline phosphatase family protein [Paraburkholderia sp. J67]|uniref:alkaline phosphatase family protein n=1 Tax=Paraburkholderia sp. J67 TaxID=2805435 RepID=UPI002ABDA84D|nr:alkaline phosphatase family protein [Paraburkholderia sp. J67]